tara:strand:+ start:5133 stop:5303 length:171 start_codon:yes stop_codon:yes gene_type:complete
MEKSTKKIIEAKKRGDKELVQKLQQEYDKELKILRSLEDVKDKEDFPKDDTKNNNS